AARRRISLSVKQAAEGGEVSAEYREAFGSHAYDAEGNYIGNLDLGDFTPESEAQAAWAELAKPAGEVANEVPEVAEVSEVTAEPVEEALVEPEAEVEN
ncbi:MAG: 30S ribosomal protein S1, partial [Actinomycetota bacterium]